MLVAIFILLLIVFFPLLSLLLGVGITVVIYQYWWVILILLIIGAILKYSSRIYEKEYEETQLKRRQGNSNQTSTTIFKGEPVLDNDSYIIYLTKKFDIQKSEVLGRYVVADTLFATLNEALQAGDRLNKDELARQIQENKQTHDALAKRKVKVQILLIFSALFSIWWVIYGSSIDTTFMENFSLFPAARQGVRAPDLPSLAVPDLPRASLENSEVSSAITPSFDCSKANSPAEKLICSDSELATQDNELFELYKRAKVKSDNPVAFKAESVDAWKAREGYCKDKDCLLEWYSRRKAYYQDILNK